jgi:hypothetical protein
LVTGFMWLYRKNRWVNARLVVPIVV